MTDTITLDTFLTAHTYDYARMSELYPEASPTKALRYSCSDEFIRDAKRHGHFFDESTMRTFKTKVYELISQRFLIMSDKYDSSTPRQYRVGYIYKNLPTCSNPDHTRLSVERLETKFLTLAAARRAALELARLVG